MIPFIKPYGAISENLVRGVRERNGKYYVVDRGYNKYEIAESEYNKLKEKGIKEL